MADKIEIKVECPACGSIIFERDEPPADDPVVKCYLCGLVIGTFADVRQKLRANAAEIALKRITDSLKRR